MSRIVLHTTIDALARLGCMVIQLSCDRRPITKGWPDAEGDETASGERFQHCSAKWVALVTRGFLFLDTDRSHADGADGVASFSALVMPKVVILRTATLVSGRGAAACVSISPRRLVWLCGPAFQGSRQALTSKPRARVDKRFQGTGKSRSDARERAGLQGVRLHDLRHKAASFGASAGYRLPAICAIFGHMQASTTQHYARMANDPVHQAASNIAAFINGHLGPVFSRKVREA